MQCTNDAELIINGFGNGCRSKKQPPLTTMTTPCRNLILDVTAYFPRVYSSLLEYIHVLSHCLTDSLLEITKDELIFEQMI
jgi:hypothetical protein